MSGSCSNDDDGGSCGVDIIGIDTLRTFFSFYSPLIMLKKIVVMIVIRIITIMIMMMKMKERPIQ